MQNGVVEGGERSPRLTILSSTLGIFVYFSAVPAGLNGTRGGPARRPARGLVWPASSQRYCQTG